MPNLVVEILGFSLEIPFSVFYVLLFLILASIFYIFFRLFVYFIWLPWLQKKYLAKQKFCLLHLIMPRINEQGPEATENLFNALGAAHKTGSWKERYSQGYFQQSVSFEIASFGGDVHFFIFSPVQYRDLIEAAVYAAYPDVEIREVSDYVERVNLEFPNDEHELWGTSLIFYNKDYYPIRTYKSFEHSILDPKKVKDPLQGLIEILSKLKPGEEVWLQFVVTPIKSDWTKGGMKLIKEIAKKTMAEEKAPPPTLMQEFYRQIFATTGGEKKVEKVEKEFTPIPRGTQNILELIQSKISKTGFVVVPRMVYFAPKKVFSAPKGVSGVLGGLNGFNTLDMNGFKPNSKTKTTTPEYFLVEKRRAQRKKSVLKKFKTRGRFILAGSIINREKPCILNSEELASLYHFPYTGEKVEAIRAISSRRGRPPISLPVE